MTNADKYLKDGVVVKELWETFQAYYYKNKSKESDVAKAFRNFFEQETQPTLTEDERVILRNISYTFNTIKRNNFGWLELYDICAGEWKESQFKDELFQFIKERRRILNTRIVRR